MFIPFADAQQDRAYMILWVTPESELTISGHTNISAFHCKYTAPLTDTVWIELEKESHIYRLRDTGVTLDVGAFDCGGKAINKDFRDLLRYDQDSTITVRLQSFQPAPKTAEKTLGSIFTSFHLAGSTDSRTIDILKRSEHHENIHYYGLTALDITRFGLDPPSKFLGLIKVNKNIQIEFNLNVIVLEPLRDMKVK